MTFKEIIPDFETASACDLKKAGAWRYAEDPTTEVLCLSWAGMEGEPEVWFPGQPLPASLRALIDDPTVVFIAHNAQFEKAIWRHIMVPQFGWPDIPNSRWHDTAARCANIVIPQELEKVLKVLKLGVEKDMEGNRLTLAMSRPDKKTGMLPERTPSKLMRIGEYCKTDVFDQRALHKRIGFLPPDERRVYLLDQEINERGVRLDMDLVRAMRSIVDKESGPLAEEFKDLTGGLKMTQIAKIKDWLTNKGVWLPNMTKETLDQIIGEDEDGNEIEDADRGAMALPDDVYRALHIRRLIGSASIKKLDAMEACVMSDGRARGLLRYHRAGPGRWAGTLIQPQNFPRGSVVEEDREALVNALLTGDPDVVRRAYPKNGPVEAVVSALRHAIIAEPGHVLVAGDFAGIEARLVLALAGQHDKTALMASGVDVYIDMACDIYDLPKLDPSDSRYKAWTKEFKELHLEERQIGKNTILGCGFQMGGDKFHDRYCPKQPLEFAHEVIHTYRKVWAPKVPELWRALEDAARYTVKDRCAHEAYGCMFQLKDDWLTIRLPSGRELWYFEPRLIHKAMPWDADDVRLAWTYRATKLGRLMTIDAYGGSLTENVIQALARDLLVWAMFKCRANGLPIILTVHDEIVLELLDTGDWDGLLKMLLDIMEHDLPSWAQAIRVPIQVEGWVSPRYKK